MKTIRTKLYSQKLCADIIAFCKRFERIYLFGAGEITRNALFLFADLGIEIEAVLVSNGRKRTDTFMNTYAIFELSEKEMHHEDGVIIGLHNYGDVYDKLIARGISPENILCPQWFRDSDLPKPVYGCDDLAAHEGKETYFKGFSELESYGQKYNTDKCAKYHNYLNKYQFFLQKFKNEPISVLELGVYNGASLKMWGEYFPNAIIYGVDIDPSCSEFESANLRVLIRDLGNEKDLDALKTLTPTIIIDDASHRWSHQIMALYHLLPALKKGGIFIVEDIGTSLYSYQDQNWVFDDATVSTYDFCSAISEAVCGRVPLRNNQLQGVAILKDEIEYLASQIDMISFIHESCIIVKR